MYTTRSLTRAVVTLSLVAVLSGYGFAAQQGGTYKGDEPSVTLQIEPQASSPAKDLTIHRATQLIGEPVTNVQGEKLGTIYDLVLTPDHDQVSYVALSRGGFFGIGRSLYAVPWSAMRVGAGGSYIVPISEDELTQWRGFSPSAWPSDPARSWESRETGTMDEPLIGETRQSVQARRVSRIKGMNVKTPDGQNAGNIQDIAIAMDSGRILYTIVSFGGFLGIGPQYTAVPQGAIDFQPERRVAQLNVDKNVLVANAFPAGKYPDLADPSYARDLNQAYGTEAGPDWIVLGFIPAEEPTRQPTAPRTTEPSPAPTDRTPTPGTTQPVPPTGRMGTIEFDPAVTFNPTAVKSVQGVVTMVGKFARTGTGPDNLLLQIQADNGDLLNVHAGPLNYVGKQDFFVVSGDRVNVTGATAQMGRHSIILASQISKDGQILQLRDKDGKPLWEQSSLYRDRTPGSEAASSTPGRPSGESSHELHEHEGETPDY